jgi:pyrrolidone-carboxylate peptidase
MKTIIITAFKPFGGYMYNPTQDIIRYVKMKSRSGEYTRKIIGLILPCEYYGAFKLLRPYIEREKPYAIINTGFSSSVKGIRIENRFENIMNGKYPDSLGFSPQKEMIVPDADSYMYTNHDLNVFFKKELRNKNMCIEFSNDAENFICNSLGFLTAKFIDDNKLKTKHLFFHIPWTDNYRLIIKLPPGKVFLEEKNMQRAIDFIIKKI